MINIPENIYLIVILSSVLSSAMTICTLKFFGIFAEKKELNAIAESLRQTISEKIEKCPRGRNLEEDVKELKKDLQRNIDELKSEMREGFRDLQKLIIETFTRG